MLLPITYGVDSYIETKGHELVQVTCYVPGTIVNPSGSLLITFIDGSQYTDNYPAGGWRRIRLKYIQSIKVTLGQFSVIYDTEATESATVLAILGNNYSLSNNISGRSGLSTYAYQDRILCIHGQANDLDFNKSVAASTAETSITVSLNGVFFSRLKFVLGISSNSVGTSPNDAYIRIHDVNGDLVLSKVLNVNDSLVEYELITPGDGTSESVTVKYANGDSVAHWFVISAYERWA